MKFQIKATNGSEDKAFTVDAVSERDAVSKVKELGYQAYEVKGPKIKKSIPLDKIAWSLSIIAIALIAGWIGIKMITLAKKEVSEQLSQEKEKFGQNLDDQMKVIELRVAIDAMKQYKIAKENGSAMDAYTAAGFVSAAFLQAKDPERYKQWKEIERREGLRAGLPPELLK